MIWSVHIGFMETDRKASRTELSPSNAEQPLLCGYCRACLPCGIHLWYGIHPIPALYIIAEIRIVFHRWNGLPTWILWTGSLRRALLTLFNIFFASQCGVSAVHKGGRAAQSPMRQIRMKPRAHGYPPSPLCAGRCGLEAGEHALDQPVKTEFLKPSVIRLDSHPAVIIKT